jgi:uncharacterized protein
MSKAFPAMKYRRFGRTNLSMPVFSCGGMRFQHAWQDKPASEIPDDGQKNLEATILRALEVGINHIETARGYGTSEMQLGRLLPKIPRSSYILQTKIGPNPDPAVFLENFNKSMNYLGVEHVELLSMHGINTRDCLHNVMKKGGCLEVARKLQKEGRASFIGFSTHATTEIIMDTINTGEFDYVNLHWYFVNPLTWPAVEAASRHDMGVFIISPNDKGGKLYDPPPKLRKLCEPLTPMQFNDLYCLARKEVHTLSCGAARPSDFDEHLIALDHYDQADKISSDIAARIEEVLRDVHGSEWMDHYHEELPQYYDMPHEVNVVEILRLWTYAKALDMTSWGRMRYNLLGNSGHWFPGQMADKISEPELLNIASKNRFANKLYSRLVEAHEMLVDKDKAHKRLSQS